MVEGESTTSSGLYLPTRFENNGGITRRDLIKGAAALTVFSGLSRTSLREAEAEMIELPSYRGELFPSPNYPYTVIKPDNWIAKTLNEERTAKTDNFLSRNPAPDGVFTDIRLNMWQPEPDKTLDAYADDIVDTEWKPLGVDRITKSAFKIDNGTLETIELAGILEGNKNFQDHEKRAFIFLNNDIFGAASGHFSLNPEVNSDEYARFFDMMVLSFHLTNK
jgi:hypothetical protein